VEIAAISAVVAVVACGVQFVTFFMARGKAEAKAEEAHAMAVAAIAKGELIRNELAEFREFVAREYVATRALDKVEQRLTIEMHRVTDEFARRFDELNRTIVEVVAVAQPIKRAPK
jgi:hypothetical protein